MNTDANLFARLETRLAEAEHALERLVEAENARRAASRGRREATDRVRDQVLGSVLQVDRAVSAYHRHRVADDWPTFQIPEGRAA